MRAHAPLLLGLALGLSLGCRLVESRLCVPCSLETCGPGLSCLEGVCVPPETPTVCTEYVPPPACGDNPPCADGLECFEGACVAPVQIEAGWTHACARWPSGRVSCWGTSGDGETGREDAAWVNQGLTIPGLDDVVDLSAGIAFTCVLRASGEVLCFGGNGESELGNFGATVQGALEGGRTPQPVQLPGPARRIFSAEHRSCALLEDDRLMCWGSGRGGCVFGPDSPVETLLAVEAARGIQPEDVSVGEQHTVWLEDGRVWAVGSDTEGQLGIGSTCEPGDLGFEDARLLSAGALHTCVVEGDRRMTCIGSTAGLHTYEHERRIRGLFSGRRQTCLTDEAGEVYCWGRDRGGVLGSWDHFEDPDGPDAPVLITGATGAEDVAIGEQFACLVRARDGASCWGSNVLLGDGSPRAQPPRIMTQGDFVDLQTGGSFGCGLHRDGRVTCWGANDGGQLGRGFRSGAEGPGPVPGVRAEAISVGASHVCALEDGAVTCWGLLYWYTREGIDTPTPQRMSGLPRIASLASGWSTVCALSEAAEVFCAGSNWDGQALPGESSISIPSFTAVPDASGAVEVIVGVGQTCVRFATDRVACWGALGRDDVPEMFGLPDGLHVPGLVDVRLGVAAIFLRREDGTVVAAGGNEGRLGDGRVATPRGLVEVADLTDASEIDSFSYHTCGRRAGGEVWCWGALPGEATNIVPAHREGLDGAERLAVATSGQCMLDAAGQIWCEGSGNTGLVGPEYVARFAPVRVVGMLGRGVTD